MCNLPLKWNIQIGEFTNKWEHAVTGEPVVQDWPVCGIISVADALAQRITATKPTLLYRAWGTRNSFDSFIIGRYEFSKYVALCHYLPEVVIGVCRTISDYTSADHFVGTSVSTTMCVFCSWDHSLITSDRFLYRDRALHVVWAVSSVTSKQRRRVTQFTDNLNC